MKVLALSSVVLLAAMCTVHAEPPRYRSAYAAPAATPAPTPAKVEAAPYPPSGWKPSGRAFELPSKQTPKDAVKPKEKYGPPPAVVVYGPPTTAETTTDVPTTTEVTTEETTEQPQSREEDYDEGEDVEDENAGSNAVSTAVAQQLKAEQTRQGSGVYYVLLPEGRLQRVAYTNSPNQQYFQQLNVAPQPINAGYLAIQYQDVQPIQAPIYTYNAAQQLVRVF